MLGPTVPRGQFEMFGSVDAVLAVAARDGLNDVAEVTSHYNQSSVEERNGVSGQSFSKSSSRRFRCSRLLPFSLGHAPLWEALMQTQTLYRGIHYGAQNFRELGPLKVQALDRDSERSPNPARPMTIIDPIDNHKTV